MVVVLPTTQLCILLVRAKRQRLWIVYESKHETSIRNRISKICLNKTQDNTPTVHQPISLQSQ